MSGRDNATPDAVLAGATSKPTVKLTEMRNRGRVPVQAVAAFQLKEQTDEIPWRRTRYGWEDASRWKPTSSLNPEPVPGLHPLAWSAILVLSVLSILLWASEPDELAFLLPGSSHGKRRKEGEETKGS